MTFRLRIDPIGCDGHGLCAEVLPELIGLDDWGYPVVRRSDVPPHLERAARTAATMCPKLALSVRAPASPVELTPSRRAPRKPRGRDRVQP